MPPGPAGEPEPGRSSGALPSGVRMENEMRILVLAPMSNDASLTVQFLSKAGLRAAICSDIQELCATAASGCGALLIAEEVLEGEALDLLVALLERQPSWSDLPIVIITGPGEAELRRQRLAAFGPVGNVSIIEKPVRPGTLVSTFGFALRSRRRQYQVRSLLEERDEMMAKEQQQARIFDTTLSSIADFAYTFDREGRFIYVNKALLDLWGMQLADAVGKTFFELPYPPEMAAKLHGQIRQVLETRESLRDETSYTNPAGLTGYYEYIFSPVFGSDGAVEVVAGSTRDISERRRTEEALRDAGRRKDEFLAMLSHELRNPLASVGNAVAVLKIASEPEESEWAVGVIERQTHNLARLIDDLLDVSRITTGKIRLRRAVCDVATILDRACESARPLMTDRKHEFVCTYQPGTLWIEGDAMRVEQIVMNLLTNAAKYTPPMGRIELSAVRQNGNILIAVRDNGMGIAPRRLPEMFELFAQGERSIARSEGGLGIGLTIVRRLAEMHGGRVDAHSEGANRGSTFTVRLPAVAAPVAAPHVPSATHPKETADFRRVLLVDDNVDTAQALGRLLKRAGHSISLAHDGPQALELARRDSPHAIVLDIGLPGMDGFEVVRQLRQETDCSGALIIAVTGYGQDEDRHRALEAGFDHHLVKPVDVDELKRLLAKSAACGAP